VSVPVPLDELRSAIEGFAASPYLLTVDDDGRPRSASASWQWEDGAIVVEAGARTRSNGRARPLVSLLWAGSNADTYALIVDGAVAEPAPGSDDRLAIRPTRAVLHRRANTLRPP
jgi:hypothetical protein